MMELHAFILSLLILSLVSTSEQRSLETPITCATACTEPANVAFRQGFTYEFQYTAGISSTFNANSGDSSRTNLNARIAVDALGPCEYVLRMTSARLTSPDQTISSQGLSAWENSLRENPLHFSWQDGSIPSICAANDDPTWVLNIKRGILSTLQVSSVETVEAVEETDVHGTCESSYTVTTEGTMREITKRKNFDTCEGREQHMLFTYFTPYSSDSPRQNFVHSSQSCTQQLNGNQITGTVCNERHTFRPFSNEDSGAQTNIEQRLVWTRRVSYNSDDDTLTAGNSRRTDLVFEKEDEATVQSRDISEVRTLFRELCRTMDTENYDQVGKEFIKLVFLLRRLDAPAIEQVQSVLNGVCPRREAAFREMFKDALQWCGSEGCVVFTAQLIARGPDAVPDQTASGWLNGMNLITKPTSNMLSAIMEIVETGRLMDKTYLTAGTMIHRLCEASSANCMTDPSMRRTLAVFEEKLGTNCRTTTDEKKQEILFALRALGNAGRTNSISTLASCVSEDENDMETRIAAVQTFRRMPCNTDRSALKTMLFPNVQDSELRIASYLALIKCPTPSLIQQLVILLDDVENQQVASFVWSHLNQVIESKDPLKGYMKPLLLETAFAKTHDLDPRKYSKYYEASMFSDELNAGATIESSLIWSPTSFVPRSAQMGLSVDVFGQAVNFFEAGGRVEGVETLVRDMLASDGLKNNPLSDLLMGPDEEEDEPEEEEEESEVRVSRSPDNTRLVEKREQYKEQNQKNLQLGEPNGNWYVRVFGNEMLYGNARSLKARTENFNVQSVFAQLMQGGQYSYHDDTMLVNSIHILPTGAGLPLTIAFNGSASIDVNINGNMDLSQLFTASPSLSIRGSMEPRAVVVVSGTMSVDSHVTKSGIATETTAITSWNMGGIASIENGRSISVRVDAPYQRNTLFKFKHSVMKVNGENMEEFGSPHPNTVIDCSEEFAGQRVCLSSPRIVDVFPMRGAIEMAAYMEKTDDSFDHYTLTGCYLSEKERGMLVPTTFEMDVRMDTPGSAVNRITTMSFAYDMSEKTFSFNLNRAENQVSLTGAVETEPNRKMATVTYQHNDQTTIFTSTTERTISNGVTTWSTSTTLEMPRKTISGHASATLDPSRSLAASVQIQNLLASPVIMNVTLQDRSDSGSNPIWYYGDSRVKIPGIVDTGGNFNLKFRPQSDNFKFRMSYQFGDMEQNDIVFNHKRRDLSTSSVTEWNAEQKMVITQYPRFNHFITLNYRHGDQAVDSMVKFEYGRQAGRNDNDKYLLINETLSFFNDGTQRGLTAAATIDIPPVDLLYSGSLSHVMNAASIDTNLAVGSYRMHLLLQDNRPQNGLVSKIARLETPTPWGVLRINNSIEETQRNVFDLQGVLSLGAATGLSLNGSCLIENLTNRKSVSVVVDGNGRNLLTASSVISMEENSSRFENSITSVYNNLIEFNIIHERDELRSTCNLLFQHVPNKYFNTTLQIERDGDGSVEGLASVRFNSPQGIRHYMRLQGSKMISISDHSKNITVSFDTGFPNSPAIFSVAASGGMSRNSEGATLVGAWIRHNGLEYLSFGGQFMLNMAGEIESGQATLNLRNGFSAAMSDLELFCQGEKRGDVKTISGHLNSGSLQLIGATLTATGNSRVEGTIRHNLQIEHIPSPLSVVMEKQGNHFTTTFTYDMGMLEKEITATLTKNTAQSLTLTFSQNDPVLRNFIPSTIDATLTKGRRSSDNGQGIWLTSRINGVHYLNSEMMYYPEDMRAHFKFLHDINSVFDVELPKIQAFTSASLSPRKHLSASLEVDDERVFATDLVLSINNIAFTWMHKMSCLDRCGIPRNIRLIYEKSVSGSSEMNVECEFVVDQKQLHAVFEKSEEMMMVSYNSSFPKIAASVAVKVVLTDDDEYKLVITYNNHVFKTSVASVPDTSFSFKMQQNVFEYLIPSWPRKVVFSISKQDDEVEIAGRYNQNSFSVGGTDNWNRERNTGSVTAHYTTSGTFFSYYKIPERTDIQISLSNEGAFGSTMGASWGEDRVSCSIDLNTTNRSITLDLNHNLDSLLDCDIPRTVHIDAQLSLALENNSKYVSMSGTLRFNDEDYTMFLRRSLKTDMPAQLNVTFGHNVMMFYTNYGIPFEVSSNTEISHSTAEGASVMGCFVTDLYRVVLDDEAQEIIVRNFINVTADVELFDKKVELAVKHNLPIANLPRLMKLDVAVSNPDEGLGVIYKAFKVGVTRDNVRQMATITMNLNRMQENRETLSLGFNHNATFLYQYGIPRDFHLNFRRKSQCDGDISVVYDTMKKSIGFAFDYHSHESKLIVGINHDFTIIEEAGIPKTMGFEIAIPINDHDAEFEIKYIWGATIKNAHFTLRWDMSDMSMRYRHHQNITKDYFPTDLQIRHNTDMSNPGFNTRISSGRKYVSVEVELMPRSESMEGSVSFTQTFKDSDDFPRRVDLSGEITSDKEMTFLINTERTERLRLATTITCNSMSNNEGASGSFQITSWQDFLEPEVFPENIEFFANASYRLGSEMTSFLQIARDDSKPTFMVGFSAGYNEENLNVFADLKHAQDEWANVVPKRLRVDMNFVLPTQEAYLYGVSIRLLRDQMSNQISATTSFAATDEPIVYGNVYFTHDLEELDEVPRDNLYRFLIEKLSDSLVVQANATLDDVRYVHSIDATYNVDDGIRASLEVMLVNGYLNEEHNVPERIDGSVSATWEDGISTTIMTTYGDNVMNIRFSTDEETTANLEVSQSWNSNFEDINLGLARSEDNEITMTVIIDDVQKDVRLNGNWNENSGRIEFQHPFEIDQVPNHVIVESSYRLQPDYYISLIANIDGQEHRFEGGFNKLENGFHVSSTLLDNVQRSATVRQNLVPGGISFELDHSIPELMEYVPGSVAITGSLRHEPQFNMTIAVRREDVTQKFSTEVDTQRLQFSLEHDFEFLALPRSISVNVEKSTAPLGFELCVKMNGLERTVQATFDSTRMVAEFFHTVPEFDQWFVARSVAIGFRHSTEPMGGEVYVSVDGVARRIGGSLNLFEQTFNIFQTLPEIQDYPRNITFKVAGTLVPLNGRVLLTIDETERSVAAEIQPRSLFAALTVSIPETEAFIPRHMAISGDFNSTSARIAVSAFKDGRNQAASASISFLDSFSLSLVHDVDAWEGAPSPITIRVSAADRALELTLGENQYEISGDIIQNSDNWYGLLVEGSHNDNDLYDFGILKQIEILVQGREQNNRYEMETAFNLIRDNRFENTVALTPILKKKRKSFEATYSHRYNDMARDVSVSLSLTKRGNIYSIILSGDQTEPERLHISVDSRLEVISVEPDAELVYILTSDHNIPELKEFYPHSIEIERAVLRVNLADLRMEWEGAIEIDSVPISSSGEVRIYNDYEKKVGITGDLTVQIDSLGKTFNFAGLFVREPERNSVDYKFSSTNRANDERERYDRITLTFDKTSPIASLSVSQAELNNYGIPRSMALALSGSGEGFDRHWVFNFTADGRPFIWKIDFVMNKAPLFLNVGTSLDSSISYLQSVNLPSHALAYFTIDMDTTSGIFVNETLRLEYNDEAVRFNAVMNQNATAGNGHCDIQHNVPALHRWLGAYEYTRDYWYAVENQELHAGGHIAQDGNQIGNYSFEMNFITKEFAYRSQFDEDGYDVIYKAINTVAQKQFLFVISHNSKVIIKIDLDFSPQATSRFELENHYMCDFDIEISGSQSDVGITADAMVAISSGSGNCTTTVEVRPKTDLPVSGHRVSWSRRTSEKSVNIELVFGFNRENGHIAYTLNGAESPVSISLDYSSIEVEFVANHGTKHVGIQLNNTSDRDSINLSGNFDHINIEWLPEDVPENLRAQIIYNDVGSRFIATAGEREVINFSLTPKSYSLQVKNNEGQIIVENNFSYAARSKKRISFSCLSETYDFNWKLGGNLILFRETTGKTSLTVYLVNNNNRQRFDLNAFALPAHTYDAEDFSAEFNTSSTFEMLPFNVQLKCGCNNERTSSHYIVNFLARYNDKVFSVEVDSQPYNYTLKVAQPWIERTPMVTAHFDKQFNVGEEQYEVGTANFSWSNQDNDKLNVISKLKFNAANLFYSADVDQPSALFDVRKTGLVVDGQFAAGSIQYGVNTYLDDEELGFNVNYTGNLPQLMGSHTLEVDIRQPIFHAIPSQFKTTGVIFVTSSSYSSEWSIRNGRREYAVLNKHVIVGDSSVSMDLLWRQSYYNIPFRYINLQGTTSNSNEKQGQASLQIDDAPEMYASYSFSEDAENNCTIRVDFTSGPLPVGFRTMSLSSWYKNESGRQTGPKLNIDLVVDNAAYYMYFEKEKMQSSSTSRESHAIKIAQPLDLNFFGLPIANAVDAKMTLLNRNKGSKLILSYNDNLLENPFKSTTSYRFNDGTNLLKATADIETDAAYKVKLTVTSDSLTVSTKCPDKHLDMEVVVNGQNTAERFEIGGAAKDYASEPLKSWEISFALDKTEKTIEFDLAAPTLEDRITLRGNLSQVIRQMKTTMRRLASEAPESRVHFIKGIDRVLRGSDMYIGYEVDGDATYTVHLVVGKEDDSNFIALQMKKNFELQAEVARAGVRLIDNRLVQLKLSANPVLVNFLRKAIEDIDTETTRKINWFADNLIEGLDSFKTIVVGSPAVEATVNGHVDALIADVNYYRDQALRFVINVAFNSNNKFSIVSLATEEGVRNALTSLLDLVDTGRAIVLRPFTQVFDEYFGAMLNRTNEVLVRTMQPIIVVVRKVNAGELVIDLIEEANRKTFEYIMTNGEVYFASARQPLSDLLYVDESNVIFSIPLAFEVDGLKPMPTLDDVKTWLARSALAMSINDALEQLYSSVDEYYKARALIYMPRDEMLPPFKGHAFVSGFRHFSTFDKKQYDFSSGCATSHVLASDMRENNFTVAISYAGPEESNSRNAIEVMVENRRVTVYDDYQVKVNNRVKELPIDLEVMSVMMEGNTIHVRRKDGDLDVACDFTKELCSVDVSPFYFGATAGMAGVYNNEPLDDFKTPRGTAASPTELGAEWESSSSYCAEMNIFLPCASDTVPARCNALFRDSDSPLRPCFPLVDPQPFLETCQSDLCNSSDSKLVCGAVHAYAYRCNLLGAKIQIPDQCVECNSVGSRSTFDASESREGSVAAMDLVMVVEQGSCMSQSGVASSMRKFLKKLGSSLSDARMRDVHYHVVGYGGPGATANANTITIRNKPYTRSRNHLLKTLKKMTLSTEQAHADTLGAISYASQLPFRAGAKPVIVVLSCGSCHDSEVSYSDVERQIRKQGILLHHLPQREIVAGSSSKTMFGFDGVNAFSRGSDISRLAIKPNKEDICEPLATVTGGSVWDGISMMGNNSAFHSKFSDYVVRQVGKGQAQTCRCEMNDSGVPTSVCTTR